MSINTIRGRFLYADDGFSHQRFLQCTPSITTKVERVLSDPLGVDFQKLSKDVQPWLERQHDEFGHFNLVFFGSRLRGDATENSDYDVAVANGTMPHSLQQGANVADLFERLKMELKRALAIQHIFLPYTPENLELCDVQLPLLNEKTHGIFNEEATKPHAELVFGSSPEALQEYAHSSYWLRGPKINNDPR